ncbi:uncharacterized protein LOC127360987 [Dicentrarchus labrax]|uniref:uncharacterized protein LOC127360987 n=1 Tax=Dicentrarchus labrax TaxID=13489 RepID=UPI0021F64DBD|nr:uncharacterized protein LOC127360987 [Dicentrarchus labrax]
MLRRRAVQQRGSLVFSFYCSGRTLLICCQFDFNNSKDMLLYLFLLFSHFIALGSMNIIKPDSTEEHVAEGRNINLTCKYDGAIFSIQWYRQYQRSRPEFLLYITEEGLIHPTDSDFKAHINKTEKRVHLEIISAKVTDSAVYYCALQPTVTGNTKTLYKNLWSKDNRILHNIHSFGKCCYQSVNQEEENTDLRGEGEIQGGAKLLLNYRRERNFHIQQSSIHKPETLPLSNMLSLHHCVFSLLFLYFITGKPPEFLISHLKSGEIFAKPVSGMSVTVSEDKTQMDLQISSAAVTDSALYYCAVRPTVTGNTKTLYKNQRQQNTPQHPLEGVTHCYNYSGM